MQRRSAWEKRRNIENITTVSLPWHEILKLNSDSKFGKTQRIH